jgi:hypothetical protein
MKEHNILPPLYNTTMYHPFLFIESLILLVSHRPSPLDPCGSKKMVPITEPEPEFFNFYYPKTEPEPKRFLNVD